MKKLIFFDIDGTLRSNEKKEILSQTKKLIKKLAQNPNVELGIATGRNYGRLRVLEELRPLFKYWVLSNGALTMCQDQIINEICFDPQDITTIYQEVQKHQIKSEIAMKLFGLKDVFAINDPHCNCPDLSDFKDEIKVTLTHDFHLQNKIYQIGLLYRPPSQKEQIRHFLNKMTQLKTYFWDDGYIDLMYLAVDKSYGIKQIKKLYPQHQLICIGDGPNDFEMLQLADIAITMGNSKIEKLKNIANLITPHIDEDRIYDFFEQAKLI
ncbi:HAD family hydrolase [Candidatus Phytoplasma meliae]|uniref:HAD family phosphatase n=1 Tax=Candidatus Phytoplasma meliae TaxID=1848402 RepID=A0ABS5CY27_9MOLU|nr:HAD family hydrolase [Candidatus Phytoplasma meliae]MBP5835883.1 HAD family phosphatase [Candidatus Phytoplasma meliae]